MKPNPTVSKIILNNDGTKHIFVRDNHDVPQLDMIPPTTHDNDVSDGHRTQDTASSPFDFSKYIDHPEYMDDPNSFIDSIHLSQ